MPQINPGASDSSTFPFGLNPACFHRATSGRSGAAGWVVDVISTCVWFRATVSRIDRLCTRASPRR